MTTNPTDIPEPTSPTAVVVGKRDGETVLTDIRVVSAAELEARPTKVANCARCDRIEAHALGIEGLLGRRRDQLAKARGEIDQLKARIDELEAAKPEPGPWLRGDELKAIMPTLKADDEVGVGYKGRTATGKLWPDRGLLVLGAITVRTFNGKPGPCVDALRIIERAPEPEPEPEPGADIIPDEVIEAACRASGVSNPDSVDFAHMRAALAAADAKRAELEEQE